VAEYLSNEYQNLKDQKKIINESRQESNHDERTLIKNKKKEKSKLKIIPSLKTLIDYSELMFLEIPLKFHKLNLKIY